MNRHARRWLKPLTGLVAVGVLLAVGVGSAAADGNNSQLRLQKVVNNTHGGTATGGDFTLWANAVDPSMDGRDFHSHSDYPSFHDVYTGVSYNLSEAKDGPSGYTMGSWTCDGGILVGSTLTIPSINRDNSDRQTQRVTCTLTNNDVAPILHLVKLVDTKTNGGHAVPADFTVTATGDKTTDVAPAINNDVTGKGTADSGPNLLADTWKLSESSLAGYDNGRWSCVIKGDEDPTIVDASRRHSSITLHVGQEATCTVTNTSQAPMLHLRKVVTNDNGGTAVVNDFTMTATGTLPDNVLTGKDPVDSGAIKADTFTLSEAGPSGYAGTWACDNTPVEVSSAALMNSTLNGNTLVLYPGENVTCTLTNNDIPPVLQLRKVVVNNNSGTAVATDFTLAATGVLANNNLTGPTPVDSTGTLQADTWTLSETGPAGYTGGWVCVGGTQVGSTVAVGIGGTAVCTITNSDTLLPVILPPVSVRGIATLRSQQGCVAGSTALTRLTARNVSNVVFIRDGRFVKRVYAHGTGLKTFVLSTRLSGSGVHKVIARVFFVAGASPRVTNLTHRFAQCRISPPVTG